MWTYGGYGYPMMGYGSYSAVNAIFSIFVIIFLVMVIIVCIRWLRGKSPMHMHCGHWGYENSALTILKERYAKGEIDKQEFEAKKQDLGG